MTPQPVAIADPGVASGDDLGAALARLGLIEGGQSFDLQPLSGGVSSDISIIRTSERVFVVKRALERLKVEADWHAPLDRVASETAWLEYAGSVVPGSCPRVLGFDHETFTVALEYLDPADYRNWKSELFAGRVDPGVAVAVATTLGRIHAAAAADPALAERFDNAGLFESLRIEPYFVRTAEAVAEARAPLEALIDALRTARIGLVHGDVSPKNILVGETPVILDAECATWGDPIFDAAFCLAHLALKQIHLPAHADTLRVAAERFRDAYLAEVTWEDPDAAASRIDRILPALLLARVAGASPAEYLDERERSLVHALALESLLSGAPVAALVDDQKGITHD